MLTPVVMDAHAWVSIVRAVNENQIQSHPPASEYWFFNALPKILCTIW